MNAPYQTSLGQWQIQCETCPNSITFVSRQVPRFCADCKAKRIAESKRAYKRGEGTGRLRPREESGESIDIGREVGFDCLHLPSPCPYKTCRHHLGTDIGPTCAVAVANGGDRSAEEVGRLLSVTKQRIEQVEWTAAERIKLNPQLRGMFSGFE